LELQVKEPEGETYPDPDSEEYRELSANKKRDANKALLAKQAKSEER